MKISKYYTSSNCLPIFLSRKVTNKGDETFEDISIEQTSTNRKNRHQWKSYEENKEQNRFVFVVEQ